MLLLTNTSIELGADLNAKDNSGNTALMLGNWSVQSLLKKAGASEDGLSNIQLIQASSDGNLEEVERLLKAGVDVNHQDGSALVSASGGGHLEIVDRLLLASADVNLGWESGFTPVARAAYAGYLSIVDKLLNAGANPFQRCHDGESYDALEYAQTGLYEGHHPAGEYQAIIDLLNRLK
jgi:ankyrin repeat protein